MNRGLLTTDFVYRKLLPYLVLIALLWGLKYHYSIASVEDLRWILLPTSKMVSVVTGLSFEFEQYEGYMNYESLVLIEKGCAGVNYMIIFFLMITAPVLYLFRTGREQYRYLLISFVTAFVITVFVNASRIVLSIVFFDLPIYNDIITKAFVHKVLGISLYFSSLLIFYPVVMTLLNRTFIRNVSVYMGSMIPLGTYLSVTLGVPLITQSTSLLEAKFNEHFILIMAISLLLLIAKLLISFIASRRKVKGNSRP